MPIKFYEKNKPYYEFTNFYEDKPIFASLPISIGTDVPIRIITDGKVKEWKTAEHLFQACKFIEHTDIAEQIRLSETPRKAFDLAHINKEKQLPYWHQVNIDVMEWVLTKKFGQNEKLKDLLLKTGEEELIEDSGDKDSFWGNGADGNGRNELGKTLMKLRYKIKQDV